MTAQLDRAWEKWGAAMGWRDEPKETSVQALFDKDNPPVGRSLDADLQDALTDGDDAPGFLKAGILGFPKSGKSFTAALIAVSVREHFKLSGPVAMFDTEGGSVYLRPMIRSLTGLDLMAKRARSFDSMMAWGKACLKAGVSVAIVDSVTHPWRELCDTYLDAKNVDRASRGWNKQDRLEFQDWNVLKPRWAIWTDFYLNSPLHLIICGRAGWEYEMEVNEKGKKELVKTGVKMKTEAEFGFEPSLLIEVERVETQPDKNGNTSFVRKATVLGDRFSLIDGKAGYFYSPVADDKVSLRKAVDAVAAFYGPHIKALTIGGTSAIDTDGKSEFQIEGGEDAWAAEKKSRTILCEEIQGVLTATWPSQSATDKKAKLDVLEDVFDTRSWTKVENTASGVLRAGLATLRERVAEWTRTTTSPNT